MMTLSFLSTVPGNKTAIALVLSSALMTACATSPKPLTARRMCGPN